MIDKIIDQIYIGNYDDANNPEILNKYCINFLINCTKNNNIFGNIEYFQILIDDPPSEKDINYINNNFLSITNYIDNKIKNKFNILIYCKRGMQRSATIVAIYLMIKFNLDYQKACNFIKSKRQLCFFGSINYESSLIFIQNYLKTFPHF